MGDGISGPPVRGDAGGTALVPFAPLASHLRIGDAIGAAWENRDHLGYAWSLLTTGVCDGCSLGPRGMRDDAAPGLHLCSKRLQSLREHTRAALTPSDLANLGRLRRSTPDELAALGRIPYPFVRRARDRGFSRISWSDALRLAGDTLRDTAPHRTAWLASGTGTTNEALYVLAKAARRVGSEHVAVAGPHHAAHLDGLARTIGERAATCSFGDWIGTDLLIVWGADLGAHHPVGLRYLAEARRRGTRVVVVDPVLRVPHADDTLHVREGGDQALIHAVLKLLVRAEAVDNAFIAAHTRGWEAVRASVEAAELGALVRASGVTLGQVEWLAQLIGRSTSMVSVWSEGVARHPFASDTVAAIASLHLARGALGRPLTGLMPLHRHPTVQGAMDCGLSPDADAVLDAARAGEIDVLYDLGGRIARAGSEDALQSVRLRIHHASTLHPSMLVDGDTVLILPSQTRYEQPGGGTCTSAERRVRFTPEIEGHPHIGEARPDVEIPARVVCAAFPGLEPELRFASTAAIRAEMGAEVPRYRGIERLQREGDWIQWGGATLALGGRFAGMPDGHAQLELPALPGMP
ncbi:MAG: molybdopterin-dependent oxidoreductase [Myxococcota bacterium]